MEPILRHLQWSLQALAQPGEVQFSLFPRFVVVPDELALEFDNWYCTARDVTKFTTEQVAALGALDMKLTSMSASGSPHWTDAALREDPDWENVRRLARGALQAFGWPDAPPPSGPPGVTYVPGK